MITKWVWEEFLSDYDCLNEISLTGTVFICVLLTIMTLPIDIVLSPFELLAVIISFFIERRK